MSNSASNPTGAEPAASGAEPATTSQTIHVELGKRSYPINVGPGLLQMFWEILDERLTERNSASVGKRQHVIVITDEQVGQIYLPPLGLARGTAAHEPTNFRTDRGTHFAVHELVVGVGEISKSVACAETLWTQMANFGTSRDSLVVALGGGVVGDLAGFAAASFMRGLRLVQIPTSLLAQVDSSVGGKVGINLPAGKNLVGHFWQPEFVLIDPLVLQTLDQRNYFSALAEVVKYAVILSPEFFGWLESNVQPISDRDPATLSRMIKSCCEFKAQVVAEDEQELRGRREILNYGHTLGHAIEAVAGYGQLLHGEAISIGMHFAATLAQKSGRLPTESVTRQQALLRQFQLPTKLSRAGDLDTGELIDAMRKDKKNKHGKIRFVLPSGFGSVDVGCEIEEHQLGTIVDSIR